MKTTTGKSILNAACRFAMRTSDNFPPEEQVNTQEYIASEFAELFDSQAWPELILITQVTVANGGFSKNEGENGEMGDILGVWTHDPSNPANRRCARPVAWTEFDDVVLLDTDRNTVWVEYMQAYPGPAWPDLSPDEMEFADFLAAAIPRRFRQILAHKAAAHLLGSDGQAALMGVQFGLAEKSLVNEINNLPSLPWWRRTVRLRFPSRRHWPPFPAGCGGGGSSGGVVVTGDDGTVVTGD